MTIMKNFRETTLAELVTERTGAAVVFEKHKLDFCCNGKRSLEEACEGQGLNTEAIVKIQWRHAVGSEGICSP